MWKLHFTDFFCFDMGKYSGLFKYCNFTNSVFKKDMWFVRKKMRVMISIKNLPVVWEQNETKPDSQIILRIYRGENYFLFSIDAKLGRFIKSVYPHKEKDCYPSLQTAKEAAAAIIRSWYKTNKKVAKYLNLFDVQYCDQPTLFDMDYLSKL